MQKDKILDEETQKEEKKRIQKDKILDEEEDEEKGNAQEGRKEDGKEEVGEGRRQHPIGLFGLPIGGVIIVGPLFEFEVREVEPGRQLGIRAP